MKNKIGIDFENGIHSVGCEFTVSPSTSIGRFRAAHCRREQQLHLERRRQLNP